MDQGRRSRQVAALLALVACSKPSEQAAPPPAEPPVDEAALVTARAAIAEAWLAMKDLRGVAEGELVFPDGKLPALDFRKGGNAIITSEEHFSREPLTGEARFQIVHLADDYWRLARLDKNSVLETERQQALMYASLRDDAERRIVAARYVLFVRGISVPAKLDGWNGKVEEPARFDGVALLYALSPAKLLAGIPLHVTSDPAQKLDTKSSQKSQQDKVMLALEARGRDQLWDELKKRAASLERPPIVYMSIGD